MTIEERYRERYKSGNTPWDIGQPDFNLIEVMTKRPILSCKVLDIGCGTGDNSIWLAQNHFQVIATDTSDIALEKIFSATILPQKSNPFSLHESLIYRETLPHPYPSFI